jgi:hypothetical protein
MGCLLIIFKNKSKLRLSFLISKFLNDQSLVITIPLGIDDADYRVQTCDDGHAHLNGLCQQSMAGLHQERGAGLQQRMADAKQSNQEDDNNG